jgi:PD-(D/E)XK nuclease superfamily
VPVKDPVLKNLPSVESYFEQLDLEKIADAIVGPDGAPKIAEYDFQDAKRMIWAAAEKWLPRDIYDMQITGVEEEYQTTVELAYGPQLFRGFMDVTGMLKGNVSVTQKYAGKKCVVDWKTTHNTLDAIWEERHRDSWQWKNYLHFGEAEVMLYRGISRTEGKTREVVIPRPPGLSEALMGQITGVALQREVLIVAELPVWPRKMPGSCGSFGRECPYFGDCRDGSMPQQAVLPGRSFSYSSMELFSLCPERYRRDKLTEDAGGEETDESLFGNAVHAGLAELYRQARERFQQ